MLQSLERDHAARLADEKVAKAALINSLLVAMPQFLSELHLLLTSNTSYHSHPGKRVRGGGVARQKQSVRRLTEQYLTGIFDWGLPGKSNHFVD